MFFKPKFFLDLSGDKGNEQQAAPVTVAPIAEKAAKAPAKPAPAEASAAAAPAKAAAKAVAAKESAPSEAPAAGGMTTAEAIAAELAAAAASRPAPSLATFAPECLTPGASPQRRRRGGANLAAFRDIARSYVRK